MLAEWLDKAAPFPFPHTLDEWVVSLVVCILVALPAARYAIRRGA